MKIIIDAFLNHHSHIEACVVQDPQLRTILNAVSRRTLNELTELTGISSDVFDQRFSTDPFDIFNVIGVGSELDACLSRVIHSGASASIWTSDMQILCMNLLAEIQEGIDNYYTGPVLAAIANAGAVPMTVPTI